jgi:hypothetical protein
MMPYTQNEHPLLRRNNNYTTNNKQLNNNCAIICILTLNLLIESNT